MDELRERRVHERSATAAGKRLRCPGSPGAFSTKARGSYLCKRAVGVTAQDELERAPKHSIGDRFERALKSPSCGRLTRYGFLVPVAVEYRVSGKRNLVYVAGLARRFRTFAHLISLAARTR